MKTSSLILVTVFGIILFYESCSPAQQDQLTTQSMTANIGTASFTAKDVLGRSDPNPSAGWTGKTEVTLTGSNGSSYITVAIMDWNESNPTLDYSFSSPNPTVIGGYNNGSGADDVIVSGTLHLKSSVGGIYIEGTFDGITQLGVHVNNGYFYAKIK